MSVLARRSARRRGLLGVVSLLALLSLASGSATLSLRAFTVEAGGGRSAGGAFAVSSVIGQPEFGVSSGGVFRVTGGVLAPVDAPSVLPTPRAVREIYLPTVRR